MAQKKCFEINGVMDKERTANLEQMGQNVVGEAEEKVWVFLHLLCTPHATLLYLKLFPNKTLKTNEALGYNLVQQLRLLDLSERVYFL